MALPGTAKYRDAWQRPRVLRGLRTFQVIKDAEPILPYALGIGFTGGLVSRQAGVLDPLPTALISLQGNESL